MEIQLEIQQFGYTLNTAVIAENGDIYLTGDNKYGQLGDHGTTSSKYYQMMGKVELVYDDKVVEISGNENYQIDLNKLRYVQYAVNAYDKEIIYTLGEIKYKIQNQGLGNVSESGNITAKDGVTGATKVEIKDITNGYETYISVIINKLENASGVTYIYSVDDMIRFRDSVNAGDNYAGKTVYLMVDLDLSEVCGKEKDSWIPIGNGGTAFAGTFDGNYHEISNLYIDKPYAYAGLFASNSVDSVIMNILIDNIYIYNTYGNATTYSSSRRNFWSLYGQYLKLRNKKWKYNSSKKC
ncbi:MAG: hypothetical protein HFJ50_01620 [Clostridia bacterium]|jgi:hypothetical protein|nr:hypothetical protein [Clostridia bacterium]